MALFGALHTAGSGMTVHRTWLDAIADNVANVNTLRPTTEPAFQARRVVATAVPGDDPNAPGVGGGAAVAGVLYGDAAGRLIYQPGHPFADANGLVRAPDIDLGQEMVEMLLAQRGYQANVAVLERARDAYQQAIALGR
jgi:flagellar basal-body rod protein FlgC